MMRRTWAALLATALLVVAGAATPAAAAIPDKLWVAGTSVKIEPLKQRSASKITIRLRMVGNGAFTLSPGNEVVIESDDRTRSVTYTLQPTAEPDLMTVTAFLPNDTPTGPWWMHVAVEAKFVGSGQRVWVVLEDVEIFQVRRNVRVSMNASPEPVAKGKTITVSGHLTRLDAGSARNPDDARYVPYPNETVSIWFDPKGAATARRVGFAPTSSTGAFRARFTAVSDGYWSVQMHERHSYVGAASRRDYLDVR